MFQPDLLKDKRILVTGGGSGLGKSMARRFLELGAKPVICGRRSEVLSETAEEFDADFPGRTERHSCDIRDPGAIEAMMAEIWADGPLDALVNNAAGNFLSRSEEISPRGLDAVLSIVAHGTAYVTLAAGKRWIADRRPGNVLSIVATYAETGSSYVLPSAMGKAAVRAMTQSLAVEWGGRGVRLNAIAPGPFPTEGAWSRLVPNEALNQAWKDRVPLGRFGEHDELGNLAAFLLSDLSGYINGETIVIDGGEWLKGAGEFSLMEQLTEEEWAALKKRK
jgi:NAD(P)-dependent dehydrogenase (short-subunit alcohol dehydrogenase family)